MVCITRRDMIMKMNLKINLKMILMILKLNLYPKFFNIDLILLIYCLIMILKINL